MMRVIASILLLSLSALAVYAESPVAGKWNCVATPEGGTEIAWTLVVTDEAGKLSGTVIFASGDKIGILEPTLNGDTFSFKVQINPEETVELTGRIDGSKIDGKFKGKASGAGTFKGTRQS